MPENPTEGTQHLQVRHAPKYGVFVALGAAVGLIVAMILSTVFDGTQDPSPFTEATYTTTQAFGFICLWCLPAGILLGLVIAWILDRTVGRRTRTVAVTHETEGDAHLDGTGSL
ncbi:MAG: potassium transporter Trk [Microbacterium sp.]